MKRFAVTLLIVAASPLILATAFVMWAMYAKDAQPIVYMGEDE